MTVSQWVPVKPVNGTQNKFFGNKKYNIWYASEKEKLICGLMSHEYQEKEYLMYFKMFKEYHN